MKIILTHEERLKMFHDALCNAVGTGHMNNYGLELTYDSNDYELAKQELKKTATDVICYEDILLQIVKDGKLLTFKDYENHEKYTMTIKDLKRIDKMDFNCLSAIVNEQDDVYHADILLQTVFCRKVIYA